MEVVGEPETVLPVHEDINAFLNRAEGRAVTLAGLERFAFYERVREAFAVVATTEDRPYANVILIKGVVTGAGPAADSP